MAYVLSLPPQSPLKRSFSDSPYHQSYSPPKDHWLGALADISIRNASACSMYPIRQNKPVQHLDDNENTPPTTSQSSLVLTSQSGTSPLDIEPPNHPAYGKDSASIHQSRVRARVATPFDPSSVKTDTGKRTDGSISEQHILVEAIECDKHKKDTSDLLSLYEASRIPLPERTSSEHVDVQQTESAVDMAITTSASLQPFRRWMSTLRRRHALCRQGHECSSHRMSLSSRDDNSTAAIYHQPEFSRRLSGSIASSMGIVMTMKTASETAASMSIAPRSDLGRHSVHHGRTRESEFSDARRSVDSYHGRLGPTIDETAWLRSLQRRKVVEELISSEESYVADLKVLINDYFMILATLPALPTQTKTSIQQNISQILQLHEDLLSELHQTVPNADFTSSAHQESHAVTKAKHIRFHSADIIPGRLADHRVARRLRYSLEIGRSPDRRPRGLVTDTYTVGNIAKIFNKHMKRFFTYEEYGAHWTTMSHDLTDSCRALHGWHEYERGIEALQKMVTSDNNRDTGSKKALSFADLLIKPIQRVCKYPLLFDDLCRHTPVYDDPEAHSELEKAVFRLQETIREVNKAKDDPKTRRLIEITWQLQDRLMFPEQAISKALAFRLLGHVLLCGVLHVTFQTPEPRIKGQYMICVLYKSCLVLATSSRFQNTYTVIASVGLANSSIEEAENGRGMQCHNAPHTWKLVFENNHRLHEVILSACSSVEEDTWRKQLRERSLCETQDYVEGQSAMQDIFSTLTIAIKSLGPVFGHADSLVRRMSVHRAATLGAKPSMCQVIIKNTQSQKAPESRTAFSPGNVARSQSLMSANYIPTLAPRRAERIRLENLLEDVWTKDILPYPGMSGRRVEHQIRASATSVMRKLSMASIASNFSRRSPSFSSVSNTRSEDSIGDGVHGILQRNLQPRSVTDKRPARTVVDFHTAPAAFLPTDFEIQETRPCSRRRRLANRAAGTERSMDRMNCPRPTRVRRLSTHNFNLSQLESSAIIATRTTSNGSNATVIHPPEGPREPNNKDGIERPKRREMKESTPNGDSAGMPRSKLFGRSKSRIFKFWA